MNRKLEYEAARNGFTIGLFAVYMILASSVFQATFTEAVSLDCHSSQPTLELVTNGGFEDGENGWHKDNDTTHLAKIEITGQAAHCGTLGLKLVGPGQGYYQDWMRPQVIASGIKLQFYIRLEKINGEINPHALFHLYFLPHPNIPHWPRYHIDISVTPDDIGDPTPSVSDPAPGTAEGAIFLSFNRKHPNDWIPISVDVTSIIEKYMPDYLESQVSGILLESSEGGIVYYDDVSVGYSNPGLLGEYLHLVWAFLLNTRLGQVLGLISGIITIIAVFLSIFRHFKKSTPQIMSNSKPKKKRNTKMRRHGEARH